jgi:hypothetical protein
VTALKRSDLEHPVADIARGPDPVETVGGGVNLPGYGRHQGDLIRFALAQGMNAFAQVCVGVCRVHWRSAFYLVIRA